MVEAPQGRKGVAQFDVRLPKSVRARSVQECPQLEVGLTCRRGERMPADGTSRSWAASGKTVNWFGKADVQREYIYVPDAMRTSAAAGARAEAFGAHWCLPGGGPLSGRQAADIAGRHLEAAGQAALGWAYHAAHRRPVQQGFAWAAAGGPRLYEAGPLQRAQTARPTWAAADDFLRCRHRSDPCMDRVGPVTHFSPT
jgi:hypothetical protein